MSDFEPMLAERKLPDLTKLRYPLVASPKLDGIRCVIIEGRALARSLKPIPNEFVQSVLSRHEFNGLDGELIVGERTDKHVYNTTYSGVMKKEGEPDFIFYVFDDFTSPEHPFAKRMDTLRTRIFGTPHIKQHEAIDIFTPDEVLEYEKALLEEGYEGVILRSRDGAYKFGRSTMKEQGMLKLKRFVDKEFEIVGTIEMQHNGNEAFVSELGRTKRSKAQEGLVPMGTLGALVCKLENGLTFEVGTGYTQEMRAWLWQNREQLIGKHAKVKYFEPGSKDRPRHPVYLGLRQKEDMS